MPGDLRLHLTGHEAADQQRRGEAALRLLEAVELLGAPFVELLLEDLDKYGVSEERRWLQNICACRGGRA